MRDAFRTAVELAVIGLIIGALLALVALGGLALIHPVTPTRVETINQGDDGG